jgi:hypothetical protein
LQKIVTGMYAQKMALKKLFAWIYKKSKIWSGNKWSCLTRITKGKYTLRFD